MHADTDGPQNTPGLAITRRWTGKHRQAEHDAGSVSVGTCQLKWRRRGQSSAVAGAQQGLQCLRHGMDFQPQNACVASPWPEKLHHVILRTLLRRPNRKVRRQAAVQMGVASGPRLEGAALIPGNMAGEVDVLHPRVAAGQRKVTGHALELAAPQLRVDGQQAAHALQQFGMRFHAPLQRIGKQPCLLGKARLRDGLHGRGLLQPQRIAGRAACQRQRQAWQPVPEQSASRGEYEHGGWDNNGGTGLHLRRTE